MYKTEWKLSNNAFLGTGGFSTGAELIQYPRETDDKFEARKKLAYYVNYLKPSVNRFVNYLFKKSPQRDFDDDTLEVITDNIDLKGNDVNIFMQNFVKNAKIRGSNLVLIDNFAELPDDLQTQLSNRAFPYLVEISPENVESYKLDKAGAFEFISYADTIDMSTYEEEKILEVIRYWDKEKWIIYLDSEVYQEGDHNLGVCPVLSFDEDGMFPSLGEYYQIVQISKRIYNLNSELDEVLRGQTFNILTYDATDVSVAEIKEMLVGVNNVMAYKGTAPSFISPSGVSAETIQNKIDDLKEEINNIALRPNKTSGVEKAESIKYKYEDLNSALNSYAIRLQDFESRIFEIIYLWLGREYKDVSIKYPNEFKITDLVGDITVAQEAFSLNMGKRFEVEVKKNFASQYLDGVAKETMDEIFADIDSQGSEVVDVGAD